jgi:predicted DCC family thiol-disulfide oxidoreductase YuxK
MSDLTHLYILYDGACPFCSSYAKMIRLQENYSVELINARDPHPLVQKASETGLDLDEGMIVVMDDIFYHGDEAMRRIALMTAQSGALRRLTKWTFSNPRRSRILYPILRAGRNLSLKLLGHNQINNLQD